jgi:hypothetical protein
MPRRDLAKLSARTAGSIVLCALAVVGCAKPMATGDGAKTDGAKTDGAKTRGAPTELPGHTPGMPGLGAHAMSFYHLGASTATSIATPAMATQPLGSTIVVGVGRGYNPLFALPSDTRSNTPYQQIDTVHPYTSWPDSGTAVYAFTSASGGSDFRVITTTGKNQQGQFDEVTLAAVEVIEGSRINDQQWNEALAPPLTSGSVTTTGPATLIAFWWGDGFPGTPQSAVPDSRFSLIDTNTQERDSFVQGAVAVKNVSAAGTYSVTWTATPSQGAQMWLIAVQ